MAGRASVGLVYAANPAPTVFVMALTPDCLAQLGLKTDPFGAAPDEDAVYRDALLDGNGELALRALVQPSALLVLAGSGGVGRSIQLQQILTLVADEVELIAFRARPRVGFEAIDATIRFHLSELGSQDPGASLRHLMEERLRAGQTLLLAIDDAHLIAEPVLEQLFELRRQILEHQGTTVRFFLVGDPAFAANPLPGLTGEEDARVLRMHLRAFNQEQTRAYVAHRLRSAGYSHPEQLLDREAIERLHETSNGLPKYLNALATDWLEDLCDQNRQDEPEAVAPEQADPKPLSSVAQPAAPPEKDAPENAVVSAMTALEALRNASREALTQTPQSSPQTPAKKPSTTKPPAESSSKPAPPPSKPTQRAKKSKGAGRKTKAQATPLKEKEPIWNRSWFVPGVAVFSLFAILLPLLWQLPGGDDSQRPGTRLTEPPRPTRVERPPVAPGTPRVAPLPKPATTPIGEERPLPALLPQETNSAVPAEEAPTSAGLDREWILRQPAQYFTIQLVAARTETAARQYAQAVRDLDLRFVPISSKAQDFVVVLAGAYPKRADAEQALERLPETLREQGYWIRTVDSVRKSLR